MKRIIFSLDTEDYITPQADDAAKFWADLFTRNGIRGGFNIVAQKARRLRERGRQDVILALKKNEINYHSNLHSWHPTFPEYLEGMKWKQGVHAVIEREIQGLNDVAEIFGTRPLEFINPGNSGTPHVFYAMAEMGIRVNGWINLVNFPVRPFWFCNILTGVSRISEGWDITFDSYYENWSKPDRPGCILRDFDRMSASADLFVFGTHPTRLVTTKFWDMVNLRHKNRPLDKCTLPPLRGGAELRALMDDLTKVIGRLRRRKDVEFITYEDFHKMYKPLADAWIPGSQMACLARKVCQELNWYTVSGTNVSLAETFACFVFTLAQYARTKRFPAQVTTMQAVGPVDAIPEWKGGIIKLPVSAVLHACEALEQKMIQDKCIPSVIPVGGMKLGPGVFIRAMAAAIGEPGCKEVTVRNTTNYPAFALAPDFLTCKYKGTWLHPPEFEGEGIVKLVKNQSWTIKPATAL